MGNKELRLMVSPLPWPMLMQESLPRSYPKPLLFLMYINDLSDGLSSNAKLFADDTSLFSIVHDINWSAIELNSGVKKSNDWVFSEKLLSM